MRLSLEGVKLLERVKRLALAEPKRIAMKYWLSQRGKVSERFGLKYPACGTVGCVGGWVEVLYRRNHPRSQKNAAEILGLTSWQADVLFMDYELIHAENQQTKKHAAAVAKHVDSFVAHQGDR